MTFHLHVGAHKTASTHLQAILRRNGARLEAAGARVILPDEARMLTTQLRRPLGAPLRALAARRRLAELLRGADRALASDQDAMGRCDEMIARAALYPAARARLRLWRRAAKGRETTVWLSIRAYAPFLSGVHAQALTGRQAAPLPPHVRARLAALPRRWPDVVGDIRAVLPEARLIVWDCAGYAALRPRILAEMTGGVGLEPVNRRPMATPSGAAMAAIFAAPAALLTREALDAAGQARPIGPGAPRYDPWSETERAAMDAAWAEDRERVAALPGVEMLEPG